MHLFVIGKSGLPSLWCGHPIPDAMPRELTNVTTDYRKTGCTACRVRARKFIERVAPNHLDLFPEAR